MKSYDNHDNFHERKHVVEVTLQSGEHKGSFRYEVSGNTFGASVLGFFDDFEELFDYENIIENKSEIHLHDDDDEFCVFYLKNESGETCEVEIPVSDIGKYVVKLEIVSCEKIS